MTLKFSMRKIMTTFQQSVQLVTNAKEFFFALPSFI